MLCFLLFGRGRVSFFAVWAGAQAPPKQQKNPRPPPKQQKHKHAPAPSERVCFFCCLGGWACLFFCCLGGGVFIFFAVWAGGVFFCCLGRGRVHFLLFGRWARFFLMFGQGACCCFCCLGGGREFTHLPVCLARLQATQQQKRPNSNNKKT